MARWIKGIITLLSVVLLGITVVVLGFHIRPFLIQKGFLSSQEYKTLFEYSNNVELPDSYYLVGNLLVPKDSKIRADVFMEKKVSYSSLSPFFEPTRRELGPREVILSKNLASTNNLNVGETVSLHSASTDSYEEYMVVELIPDAYGLLSEHFDTRYGIIVVGYSADIISDNVVSSVVFGDRSFSASQNALEIKSVFSRNEQLAYCNEEISASIVRSSLALGIINLAVFVGCYIFGIKRLQQKIAFGSNNSIVAKYIVQNYMLIIIIPSLIAIGLITAYIYYISCSVPMIILLPILTNTTGISLFSIIYYVLARRMKI